MNKIALGAKDDERKQTPDGMISFPYGIGSGFICSGIVCKVELMRHQKIKKWI